MRCKQWEQIGAEYEQLANRMLMSFEKKFTAVDDIRNSNGNIRLEMLTIDKGVECVYTFHEDILPLYIHTVPDRAFAARAGESARLRVDSSYTSYSA